ncbi:MAG: hypothetical protein UZ20_WS6002000619 [candidate division WS6 bacterium OLB21]|uniref:ATPase AAA-type core domain-containing protein n=1 Tax=candidate division WS6 bacterium OLB21 TaxID=1617427 RepID=A0A136KIP5_9BACT|nr:MAG: hypothetical protein UZ20_WS6002000619 [candidate division WS6 bacterium OLB21]
MKIKSFRIIDCFGFKDSGWVNLESQSKNNLFYIIGRNSSGKSTFLRAVEAFEYGNTPGDALGFKNYKKVDQDARLGAIFELKKGEISAEDLLSDLSTNLLQGKSGIPTDVINSHEPLTNFLASVKELYSEFILGLGNDLEVEKLERGRYIYKDKDDTYVQRLQQLEQLINNLYNTRQGEAQQMRIDNRAFNLGFNAQDIENLLLLQFPKVYYFNKEYDLTSNLPEIITTEHIDKFDEQPEALKTFIEYIGRADITEYVKTDDTERQAELDKLFSEKIALALANLKYKFLDVFVAHNKNGLQLTFKASEGSSFFYLLSDNTKFLFHYLIYSAHYDIGKDIILFDEPNNGFHATAQQDLLDYLKRLAENNTVIVSTHSEYLIDTELLENIRRMSRDDKNHLTVVNDIKNNMGKEGEYLSLQPVAESIGLKYVNQLMARNNIIIVEGLSDLYYLRSFSELKNEKDILNILPGRGDSSMLTIVPFVISQGLSFKVVLDTNQKEDYKKKLVEDFGVSEDSIYIIPPLLKTTDDSGVEDIFSKVDFKKLVLNGNVKTTKSLNF